MPSCSSCGHDLDPSAKFCPECGNGIDSTLKIEKIKAKPANRLSAPAKTHEERRENKEKPRKEPPSETHDWEPQKQWHPKNESQKGGGFGTASLIFSLLGMSIFGLIFGIIGLTGNRSGRGRATAGLIISIIGIIAWIAGIIAMVMLGVWIFNNA